MSLKFNRSQDRFIVYRQNGRCGNCGGELKYVAQQYQESVNQLKSFGYFKEKMPHLENLCSEFETTIDGVVGYVESEHIEYVHGRSVTVSGVLSDSLGL